MRATSSSGLGWVLVVVPVERFWEAVRRSICPLISRQHELDISVLRVLGAVLRLCPAASVTGSTSFCSGGGGLYPIISFLGLKRWTLHRPSEGYRGICNGEEVAVVVDGWCGMERVSSGSSNSSCSGKS